MLLMHQNESQRTHNSKLLLFPGATPLELLTIDNLVQLPRITTGTQRVVSVRGRFSKFTRAILTAKIDSTQISTIFLEKLVTPYEITSYVLTDNGPHL